MDDFIRDALKGKLEYVEEKTDAVNLMVSWRDDKGMIASRNKSHTKNFGENAMSAQGIRDKFKGRALEHAYGFAMDDLQAAIQNLSKAQRDKIFGQGKRWMSIEVMGHGAENILTYNVNQLRLHGTIEHNEAGEQIAAIDKSNAAILDGMLRQKGLQRGKNFDIMKLNRVKLPEVSKFKELYHKYSSQLRAIMTSSKCRTSDTIHDMKVKLWTNIISKHTNQQELISMLLKRWVEYDKSLSIVNIKKSYPSDADWINTLEKDQQNISKQMMIPLEKLFIALGADRLETMTDFMALNPDETVQNLRSKIDASIQAVRKSGNPDLINKLELELDRMANQGKLMPTEGITFFWRGKFLKLTGNFAPGNQITGLLYRL